MRRISKRVVILLVGWGFIFLGILGLFLPVLQGVLFLVIGLVILSSEYAWAHRLLQRLIQKFPGISRHIDAAKKKASVWLSRLSRQHHSD